LYVSAYPPDFIAPFEDEAAIQASLPKPEGKLERVGEHLVLSRPRQVPQVEEDAVEISR
jgi:hypothetical protein